MFPLLQFDDGSATVTIGAYAARRMKTLHVAMVTETYPPEVNGVARTIAFMVGGLRARGHRVQLVRPRQNGHDHAGAGELLARGLAIPRCTRWPSRSSPAPTTRV